MKKIFAVISSFVIFCACTISAYAVHPSGGGASVTWCGWSDDPNDSNYISDASDKMLTVQRVPMDNYTLPDNYHLLFSFFTLAGNYDNSYSQVVSVYGPTDVDSVHGSLSSGSLSISFSGAYSTYRANYKKYSANTPSEWWDGFSTNSSTDFSITLSRYHYLISSVPIILDDGTELSPIDSSNGFSLHGYMDDRLMRHYSVSSSSTGSYTLTWLVYPGHCPYSVEHISDNFDISDPYDCFDYGYSIGVQTIEDMSNAGVNFFVDHGYVSQYMYNRFDITDPVHHSAEQSFYDSICSGALAYGKKLSLTLDDYTFNVVNYSYQISRQNFPSQISVVAIVREYGTGEIEAILSDYFDIDDILALRNNNQNIDYEDTHEPWTGEDTENPTFSGSVEDIQSLSDFAKFLARFWSVEWDNLAIMLNNMTLNIRTQIEEINWHDLIGTGVSGFFYDFIDWLSHNPLDTDYDLTSLVREITPLLDSTTLSLPDLSTALAPVIASADLDPSGNFVPHLDGLFDDLDLSLGGITTAITPYLGGFDLTLGDINTQLGDLAVEVGELSAEIDVNARALMLPDADDLDTRISLSSNRLKSKFEFVSDVKDGFDDIRETIDESQDEAPDWSFTLYGKKMYLVNFEGFQPYRSTLQNILLAVAYVLLGKYVFKTLPGCFGDGDK